MFNGSKILIIAPHLDDEILGCGGLISKYHKVSEIMINVICVRQTNIDQIRQSSKITKKFWCSYNILGYKDEQLDQTPISNLIKSIESTTKSFCPDIVLIPNKGDINFDHKIVHEACLIAFRRIQTHTPSKLIVYEVPSSTTQGESFSPNLYVELEEEDVKNKSDMMNIYKEEVRDEPNPRNERGIRTYAAFRGMECNKQYAEAFKTIYEIL